MATTGALPQNQIDALPLITPAQAVQASTIIRAGGGQFYKLFTPNETGINLVSNTVTALSGGFQDASVVSNYLDLSFCNRFRILLRRTISNNSAQAALTAGTWFIQMRTSSAEAPAVSYANGVAVAFEFVGRTQIGSTGITFPSIEVGTTQTICMAFGDNAPGDNVTGGFNPLMGGNCRIGFGFGGGAAQPAVNVFSMWVEAQT